jgi:hypothetical protein
MLAFGHTSLFYRQFRGLSNRDYRSCRLLTRTVPFRTATMRERPLEAEPGL